MVLELRHIFWTLIGPKNDIIMGEGKFYKFFLQHLPGLLSYTYIPYHLDQDGKAFAREGTDPHSTQVMPLVKKLKGVLQETCLAVRSVQLIVKLHAYSVSSLETK